VRVPAGCYRRPDYAWCFSGAQLGGAAAQHSRGLALRRTRAGDRQRGALPRCRPARPYRTVDRRTGDCGQRRSRSLSGRAGVLAVAVLLSTAMPALAAPSPLLPRLRKILLPCVCFALKTAFGASFWTTWGLGVSIKPGMGWNGTCGPTARRLPHYYVPIFCPATTYASPVAPSFCCSITCYILRSICLVCRSLSGLYTSLFWNARMNLRFHATTEHWAKAAGRSTAWRRLCRRGNVATMVYARCWRAFPATDDAVRLFWCRRAPAVGTADAGHGLVCGSGDKQAL